MAWRVEIAGAARKQLAKLDQAEARRIVRFLRERVEPSDDPRQLGKLLKGQKSPL